MWQTIKNILQKNKNASIIIIENEKPLFVILNFEEYQRLTKQVEVGSNISSKEEIIKEDKEEKIIEEVNQEIINLEAANKRDIQDVQIAENDSKELTVEDIPVL